ncbi:transcription factor Ouib [Plutella xylostella]|uniref:transcription factor Ouib n=1 Tax=Plutella xylostella TaxID=51655 RepID=UPI002032BEB2|nr:transcription factor Ouib [Plutella xylostella]
MSSSYLMYHNLLASSAEDNKAKIQKNRPEKFTDQKCRLCREKPGSIRLFNNELRTNIVGEIYSVTGVVFRNMKDLSTYICQSCVDQLDSSIRFRNMCQQSNRAIVEVNVKQEYCDIEKTLPTDKRKIIKNQSIKKEEDIFNNDKSKFKSIKKNTATIKVNTNEEKNFLDSSDTDDDDFDNFNDDDNLNDEGDKSQCTYNKNLECLVPNSWAIPKLHEILKKKEKKPKELKQHLCESCGKEFDSLIRLKYHMVIHENVFPFACDKCPYKGRTKNTLVTHMKSHLPYSERTLCCPHCSKKTTTTSNMNSHIRRVHTNNGERNFKCTRCEKDFKNNADLKRHFNVVHENMGTTKCQICYKVFNKKNLRKHLWRVHKIQKEKSNLPNRLPAYLLCNPTEDQSAPVATQQ